MSELDELKGELQALKKRLDDVEESQTNHVGLDWGASGQNYPHPNQQIAIAEFGGGVSRLDSNGIQIKAPDAEVVGIYWVDDFAEEPGDEVPKVSISGWANADTTTYPNGVFTWRIQGVSGERYGRIRHIQVADGSAANLMEFWHSASAPSQDVEYGQFYVGGTHFHRFLGGAYVDFNGLSIRLGQLTADPTSLADGAAWYRSDTDQFDGRRNGATKHFLMEGDTSGMMKVQGSGYLVMPPNASGTDPVNSGSAWASGDYSAIATTSEADYIFGLLWHAESAVAFEAEIDIATGAAASETVVSTIPVHAGAGDATPTIQKSDVVMFPAPIAVATNTSVSVRVRSSSTTLEPKDIKLVYVKQSDLVAL